jgi:hypothetical protein
MTTLLRPHCDWCKHLNHDWTCAAYPTGIPREILFSDDGHWHTRGDDGGVVFELKGNEDGWFRAEEGAS